MQSIETNPRNIVIFIRKRMISAQDLFILSEERPGIQGMIIMGIDPGFAITGYGILDYTGNRFKVLDYGVIRTEAGEAFTDRLLVLHRELEVLMGKYKPVLMAVEELFFRNECHNRHQGGTCPRGDPAVGCIGRHPGLRIHAHASEACCCRLWKCEKTAGPANGQGPVEPGEHPEAGTMPRTPWLSPFARRIPGFCVRADKGMVPSP